MELTYQDFERILKIGIQLSKERNTNQLLASIIESGISIAHCDACTFYLYENDCLVFKVMKTLSMGISRGEDGEPVLDMPPVPLREENVCAYAAIHRKIVNIPDVNCSGRFDFSGPKHYDDLTGYRTRSMLVIPVADNEGELIGVLQLINAMDDQGTIIPFDPRYEIIIRSLSSLAAIELMNLRYVEEINLQLHSFVEAMATAIDERTPYNGNHTRRVAGYIKLLAEQINRHYEASECEDYFDEARIEKLELAALLHDIGKLIVPLSIMNRATRLDKGMERVEKRFELIAAWLEIDFLKGRIAKEEYRKKTQELQDVLDFIHQIDGIGYLDDERYAKVKRIAGLVYEKGDHTKVSYLTAEETEELCIRRGTLTRKDRDIMEGHVVMTARILSKVHFNKNYKMVPIWAAGHHELLDGSGYPDGRSGEQLDLETRMLTVCDIYDALTSRDRPYKKTVPPDKAFAILREMAGEGKLEERLVTWLEEATDKGKRRIYGAE